MTKIDMADVCELGHELTRRECIQKSMKCDVQDEDGEGTHYSDGAQIIFDQIYDIINEQLKT